MDEKIKKTAKDFVSALDKAIASGSWDETNFVLILGKKLRAMRDDVAQQVQQSEGDSELNSGYLARQLAMKESHVEVFVSLFSIEGVKLQSWEQIVINLRRHMVSRPVYATEEEIISIIKTKEKKINEAYVSIFVKEEDILKIRSDKVPVDKLGQKMMVLKDDAIALENINRFVHLSGEYRYSRGRLLKTSAA
ncbi:MAG: Dot/Icm secretion system protein IcmQ [Legionellaceae bacterium]|nr:Dot/Icm secretion system protein IcmQ [Legionellaceae bacterium]